MRRIGLALVALIVIVGCKSGEKAPIPRDKFVDVLIDFAMNEGTYSKLFDSDTNVVNIIAFRNAQILKKHSITKKDFVGTFKYYDSRKEELLSIYQEAIVRAEARMEKIRKELEKKPAQPAQPAVDSVKKSTDSVTAHRKSRIFS